MEKYLPLIRKYIMPLKRYSFVIAIAVVSGAYGFLVLTASQQANIEPSEASINEKFMGASRPKLDSSAAKKLQELEAQNIQIQAIFNEARNNPFAE